MIKAVLFDMDGLLVDSETLAMKTIIKLCAELSIVLAPGEETGIIGITEEKFFSELIERHHASMSVQDVLEKFRGEYEQLLHSDLQAFDGAKTLPQKLKARGLRLGLVSGSPAKQIDIILTCLDMKGVFEVIVSAEDTSHSKPEPEEYLLGAQKLGVNPDECIVLEDAKAGVEAGKTAGMKVIGVRNNNDQDLSAADEVVNNLTEVKI